MEKNRAFKIITNKMLVLFMAFISMLASATVGIRLQPHQGPPDDIGGGGVRIAVGLIRSKFQLICMRAYCFSWQSC